jgi:hypothetical protein
MDREVDPPDFHRFQFDCSISVRHGLLTRKTRTEQLAALANEPEPNRPDRARLDQATLLQFSSYPSRVFVQVRSPGEESRSESSVQLPSHLMIRMEIAKRSPPLVQANRC